MTEEPSQELKEAKHPLRYPWWEPCRYTGGVILLIGVSVFADSFVATGVAYFEPIMIGVVTVLTLVSVLRGKASDPKVVGKF